MVDGHVGAPAAGERRGLEEARLGKWNGGPIANFAAFVSERKRERENGALEVSILHTYRFTIWAHSQTPFPVSTLEPIEPRRRSTFVLVRLADRSLICCARKILFVDKKI